MLPCQALRRAGFAATEAGGGCHLPAASSDYPFLAIMDHLFSPLNKESFLLPISRMFFSRFCPF